ncbi:unnamed protein product, partial [marine sediment metagenome]
MYSKKIILDIDHKKNLITLKDIFYILVKNKIWFAATFLVVFICGLIFTFIRPTIYSMETSII